MEDVERKLTAVGDFLNRKDLPIIVAGLQELVFKDDSEIAKKPLPIDPKYTYSVGELSRYLIASLERLKDRKNTYKLAEKNAQEVMHIRNSKTLNVPENDV